MKQVSLTMSELKNVLYKKIIVSTVILFFSLITFIFVRHYFYIFDSYYYNAEFHFLFIANNLRAGNTEMFTDYFRSMGSAASVCPMLMLSHLIQNYYLPFSPQILTSAVTSVFNPLTSNILNFLSFILVGLISFGVGMFFLGDICPFLQKRFKINTTRKRNRITSILLTVLFAIPVIPISGTAIISAILRVPFVRISKLMAFGLAMRLLWLFTLAEMFQ